MGSPPTLPCLSCEEQRRSPREKVLGGWAQRQASKERKKEREGERQIDGQRVRETDRETGREGDSQRDGGGGWETDREPGGGGGRFCLILLCFAGFTTAAGLGIDLPPGSVVSTFLQTSLQEQTGRMALEATECQLEANYNL